MKISNWQDVIRSRDALEKRCGELEQEIREMRASAGRLVFGYENEVLELRKKLDEQGKEAKTLRDRIGAQNWTIAEYDDENRRLKERLDKAKKNALETEFPAPFETSLTPMNDWARRIHRIAVDHGWWESEDGKGDDGDRPFPEIVALCHSELSEALEEYRNGHISEWVSEKGKPEGIAVEMIDCMIRILDWCGHEGVDVDTLMAKKVKYNEGREYRHGGKKA